MFLDIFRFEINYHRRQYLFYVLAGVFFLLAFLATTTPSVELVERVSNVNINSSFTVLMTLASLSVLTLIGAVAFSASGVIRDHDMRLAELFLSTPVRKIDYVYGRFFGSFVFAIGIYLSATLGVLLGEFMPWLDPERLGPLNLQAYWYSFWVVGLPNLFVCSCILFCISTATRSMMATYTGMVGLLMLTFLLDTFTENSTVAATSMLDPFGATALEQVTRYWTVFEKNSLLPPIEGALLINRLLWLGVGVLFLCLAGMLYPFTMHQSRKQNKKSKIQESEFSPATQYLPALLPVRQSFDFGAQWQQYLSQTRLETRNIVKSVPFAILLLLGVILVVMNVIGNLGNLFGTAVYPTTAMMVDIINGAFSLSLLFVIVYYSGELMVRERQLRVVDIVDAMPFPNWVMLAAKLTSLVLVIIAMMLTVTLAAIGVQLFKQYYAIDIPHYFFGLLFFFQFPIYLMIVLSIFFYILTRNKFFAMALVIIYIVFIMAASQLGFEHYLYRMSMLTPVYSEFTGYSQNLEPYLWQTLYWGLFGCLLLLAIHLLWPRGIDEGWRNRLKLARQRMTKPVLVSFSTITALFALTGGWIFYNTNILNEYATGKDREELQANYEKSYKQYQHLNQPEVTAVYAEVDIFPSSRDVLIRGRYEITNNSAAAVSELHVSHFNYLEFNKLDVPGATLISFDEKLGYRIYQFENPMQPGSHLDVSFDISWLSPGFANSGHSPKVTANGTFFSNIDAFPAIGYQRSFELGDNNKRRTHELPPLQRMEKIDDESALMKSGLGGSSRVNFETIVSTSADQIAVSPGYLQREWQEGDRRYFHYKMDDPIWNIFSYLSAAYKVKADRWNDVAIEVYYLHDFNVDTMIQSTKNSLTYFAENFSPYQYRQFRIFEFPRFQGTFAQAFPNTIPFSEDIGFVADLRAPDKIDYVYYVTAHELAHQWWGHQVIGADVQGSTMIIESLAQYSALMAMEKEYGAEHMKRFLEFELDRYLQGRGGELIEELPLYLVENQSYIHYRKGSVVLYALKDYIGEANMNRALANFLQKFAFKNAPYPTTRDLIASIRAEAPIEYADVITDLLEKIILFDMKVSAPQIVAMADGRFEVTVDVSVTKFEASGSGEETEIPVSVLVDLGVFGEPQGAAKVPEVIYLQKHEITENQQTFRIIVDKQPRSVGIDPFNKLIDRNPADNVIAFKK